MLPGGAELRLLLQDSYLRRVGRNAGMLLGGSSVAGLLGLASLTLAARGLGAEAFGTLMILHAYAMFVGGVSRFNVYHALVRYGAACLPDRRRRDLQGLLTFGLLVEVGGVVLGGLFGILALGWLGPLFGLPELHPAMLASYCVVVIASSGVAPVAILRLLDRFDLVAWTRPVAPGLRVVGSSLAWIAGGDIAAFAAVWALASAAEAFVVWWLTVRALKRDGWLEGLRWRVRGIVRPHPGLWRMVFWTNLHGTLGLVSGRVATLLVGALLGPTAAGLYLVAHQFASVIDRPLQMVKRALDPEFAHLIAHGDRAALDGLYRRTLLAIALCAAPLLLLVTLLGDRLLLLVETEFAAAHGLLVLLALRTVFTVLALPSDSILVMSGEAGRLFWAQLIGRVAMLGGLLLLVPEFGLVGAGIAGAASALLELMLATAIAFARLRGALSWARPTTPA